jgi:5-methyltetrahydrofolate--homocysteine methyltransferase
MVPAAKILDTAIAEDADIIGLSGLITPSLDEMVSVAAEMERRGMTKPLLIGGATTSRQHTAVRVAPAFGGQVHHVLDASRVVGVVQALLDPERAAVADTANRAEQQRLRVQHEARRSQPLLSVAAARRNAARLSFDALPVPAFTGVATVTPSLAELREMIDWTFFFLAWELKGKYPAILERSEQARELFADGNELLDEIVDGGLLTAKGGYGFWPARSDGDDIIVSPGGSVSGAEAVRLPMLRQQTVKPDGRPNRCMADFVAPEADHVGGFAVAIHGADELAARYEADGDDYKSIMVKALADRLAEAFAEWAHLRARRDWYEADGDVVLADLHAERFRGIRPALGYPASPDHTLKRELWDLLGADSFGMGLTESFAMTPAAAVSGLLFAHPESRYFTVGRINADQVADYAARRGTSLADAEKWLRPNLAYDPK